MIVAGIDQSKTQTGVAIFPTRYLEDCFTVSLKCPERRPEGTKPTDILAEYSAAVGSWYYFEVGKLLRKHKITHVAVEKPLPGTAVRKKPQAGGMFGGDAALTFESAGVANYATTHIQDVVVTGILIACRAAQATPIFVAPQTWRKSCGIGRAPKGSSNARQWYKSEAKTWCERVHIKVRNVDEAEAVGIGYHLWCLLNPRLAAAHGDLFQAAS